MDQQLNRSAAELDALTVRFGTVTAPSAVTALRGVSLSIAPGERVALIGQSGSGKTTLLGVLAGLVQPTAGSVKVLGQPVGHGHKPSRQHRAMVGLVDQHLNLALPLRVIHNVNAGLLGQRSSIAALWSLLRPIERAEALAVLDQVGLTDRANARTEDLSGGERQRIAVARVLRQRPTLVLADEPTSSVDPALSDRVMGLLCSPPIETSIVTVHDPALACRHADRIIGLRDGSVMFDLDVGDVHDDLIDQLYAGDGAGR